MSYLRDAFPRLACYLGFHKWGVYGGRKFPYWKCDHCLRYGGEKARPSA